jgi:hypothetical protein
MWLFRIVFSDDLRHAIGTGIHGDDDPSAITMLDFNYFNSILITENSAIWLSALQLTRNKLIMLTDSSRENHRIELNG